MIGNWRIIILTTNSLFFVKSLGVVKGSKKHGGTLIVNAFGSDFLIKFDSPPTYSNSNLEGNRINIKQMKV